MSRVVVIGPGAIGGVLAAIAYERGHEVALAVRTPFEVLRVRSGGTEREVPATVHTDPATLGGPADWVLVTTKAHHIAAAAGWLGAATGPGSVVVVVQNGVDQERRVAGLVDPGATVLPGVVVLGAEAEAPGRIVHHGYGRLTIPSGPHVAGLAALVGGDGGVEVLGTDDFRTVAWRKLMSNAIANPITALTGRRNDVLAEDGTTDLVVGLAREVVAVARAEGAAVSEDDVTALREHYATMPAETGTSMLYDRLAGRPLEHEYLTGAVVAAAERHGVAVPLNRTMLALLRAVRPSGA